MNFLARNHYLMAGIYQYNGARGEKSSLVVNLIKLLQV